MPVKQALERKLSVNGQLCIPAEFRDDDVEAYIVEENEDGTLTLHPRNNTDDSTQY